jgi:hypothetical protein
MPADVQNPPPEACVAGGDAAAALQRQRRRERQARVGLLRNPNGKPAPPPRRPPLIGRHLSLRSSRRPCPPGGAGNGITGIAPDEGSRDPPVREDPAPLVVAEAGRIARIDVDRLRALAESMRPSVPARTAFAADIIGDRGTDGRLTRSDRRRDPLGPDAYGADRDEDGPTPDAARPDEAGAGAADWRRWLARLFRAP